MQLSAIPLLALSLACDAAGQLSFKRAALRGGSAAASWQAQWLQFVADPCVWVGIGLFVAEFLLWLAVLSVLPLSTGVLLSSAGTVVMLAAGRIFFHEKLGPMQVLGAWLIAIGVAIVGMA